MGQNPAVFAWVTDVMLAVVGPTELVGSAMVRDASQATVEREVVNAA
jgi:hypothetical protein